MPEPADHRRNKDDKGLRRNRRNVRELDQHREKDGINAECDKVHRLEAREIQPKVSADLENETSVQHESAEDARDMSEQERRHVAPDLADRELEQNEPEESDDGIDDANDDESDTSIFEESQEGAVGSALIEVTVLGKGHGYFQSRPVCSKWCASNDPGTGCSSAYRRILGSR